MKYDNGSLEIGKTAEIIFEGHVFSYDQIQERVLKISSEVVRMNLNMPVAVFLERSENLLLSIMSMLYTHTTYVPIDINYPMERVNFILKDCCVETIITQAKFKSFFIGKKIICVDNLPASDVTLNTNHVTDDIAYILYTSGSTGRPKGVEINRNSLINFVEGVSELIDFSNKKRIVCLTEPTFDIFFLESMMALNKGLTVVLANKNEQINPKLMARLISEQRVDMIQMTPSRIQLLLNYDKDIKCLQNVKEILIGGEVFPLKLLKILQNKTSAKIYNMYGPTETTIWSTISDLTNRKDIDIGKPIKNTEIYIVNENLALVEKCEIGEICISGAGLAKGYLNNSELTEQKFVYLPQKNIKVYCTGDYGRYLKDGSYECLGRKDNQVKIRGHRIELEEVEKTLYGHPYIEKAIVSIFDVTEQDKILIAFYQAEVELNENDIKQYMVLNLPDYMIPSKCVKVDQFYYTSNGKIDRNAMLNNYILSISSVCTNSISNKYSKVEIEILKLFKGNIDNKLIGNVMLETDLSTTGINSISFIEMIVAIESKFNIEFDDDKLMFSAFKNVNEMIKYVESKLYNL